MDKVSTAVQVKRCFFSGHVRSTVLDMHGGIKASFFSCSRMRTHWLVKEGEYGLFAHFEISDNRPLEQRQISHKLTILKIMNLIL